MDAAKAALKALAVEPEDVLHVGNAFRAEGMLIADQIRRARFDSVLREPGSDPVSTDAVPRFNAKIQDNLVASQAYADTLMAIADQLALTARGYGHTEQAIRDSFARHQAAHPPPTDPNQPPGAPPKPS